MMSGPGALAEDVDQQQTSQINALTQQFGQMQVNLAELPERMQGMSDSLQLILQSVGQLTSPQSQTASTASAVAASAGVAPTVGL